MKSAGIHGQMSAPVSTHLGWPQWQALSTARSVWGRALSTSCVKQWPVVSPSHTGSGCNSLVPHNRARNLSIEASPAGRAEGEGGKVSSRRRETRVPKDPAQPGNLHPSGRDADQEAGWSQSDSANPD